MSIANILLRGAGAGLQSYGATTFQQQEQRRREEAAEQMRIRQAQEQGEQRRFLQQDKLDDLRRQQEEGAGVARMLGIDLPEGSRLTPDSVRLLATDRQQRGASERLETSLSGRMDQIQKMIESQSDVRSAQAEAARARAEADGARRSLLDRTDPNLRGQREPADPDAEYTKTVRGIAQKLMDSQRDEFGSMIGGMEPERAMMEATRRADLLFGRQSAPSAPPAPRGANLLQGISGGRPPLDSFNRR